MTLKNKLKHLGMLVLAAPLIYSIGWLAVNSQKASPANANPNSSLESKAVQTAETNEPNDARKTYDAPNSLRVKVSEVNDVTPTNIRVNYPNPKYEKDDNFASDSNEMTFARAVYGEARGELSNKDYTYGFAQTVKNRARIKDKSIKGILLENRQKKIKDENGNEKEIRVWQYSCFSPRDVNHIKLKDPIKFSGKDLWRECYDFAREMLDKDSKPKNEIQEKLQTATNYWVDIIEPPIWAYKDNDRKKDLKEPLAVVPVRGEKNKAYFYSFKYP